MMDESYWRLVEWSGGRSEVLMPSPKRGRSLQNITNIERGYKQRRLLTTDRHKMITSRNCIVCKKKKKPLRGAAVLESHLWCRWDDWGAFILAIYVHFPFGSLQPRKRACSDPAESWDSLPTVVPVFCSRFFRKHPEPQGAAEEALEATVVKVQNKHLLIFMRVDETALHWRPWQLPVSHLDSLRRSRSSSWRVTQSAWRFQSDSQYVWVYFSTSVRAALLIQLVDKRRTTWLF